MTRRLTRGSLTQEYRKAPSVGLIFSRKSRNQNNRLYKLVGIHFSLLELENGNQVFLWKVQTHKNKT